MEDRFFTRCSFYFGPKKGISPTYNGDFRFLSTQKGHPLPPSVSVLFWHSEWEFSGGRNRNEKGNLASHVMFSLVLSFLHFQTRNEIIASWRSVFHEFYDQFLSSISCFVFFLQALRGCSTGNGLLASTLTRPLCQIPSQNQLNESVGCVLMRLMQIIIFFYCRWS